MNKNMFSILSTFSDISDISDTTDFTLDEPTKLKLNCKKKIKNKKKNFCDNNDNLNNDNDNDNLNNDNLNNDNLNNDNLNNDNLNNDNLNNDNLNNDNPNNDNPNNDNLNNDNLNNDNLNNDNLNNDNLNNDNLNNDDNNYNLNNDDNNYKYNFNKNIWNKFNKNNIYSTYNKYNQKKMLCENFVSTGQCSYAKKCLYAHSLEEQNIEPHRKKLFDLLNNNNDLSHIDLNSYQNKILMKELLLFTKSCEQCINKKCTGGINCKYGVYDTKYIVCYDDLCYNYCNYNECKKIHLSKRNLKPIYNKISLIINNTENLNNTISSDYMLNCLFELNKLNSNNLNKNIDDNLSDSSDDDNCSTSIFPDIFKNILYDD